MIVTGLILFICIIFSFMTRIRIPEIKDRSATLLTVKNPKPGFYTIGRNWLKKSNSGLWELYIEGKPFERGVINGKLTESLIELQEQAFISQIGKLIPSKTYLKFLKYFIYWFNRDLDKYITEEYQEEIYGISLSASDKYNFIGSNYKRILNYHSAHDIGHALQNMHLVGCTSFGTWAGRSKDSTLIIGRNFDFYVGDDFAKNKIVCFEKPDQGYPFMMITWGGMIGAVSGMNEKGISVTINAAPSGIPWSARTPISILAREILQYSTNIHEALEIAKKRETFVSESILVGSAADNKAVIIEKTPERTACYDPGKDYIICSNHFQDKQFMDLPKHAKDRQESPTVYRYKRVLQDITNQENLDPVSVAEILRDRSGLNGKAIGNGNEKAINQLICHHSVIFEPAKGLVWVSTDPYQLGPYICYDVFKIFHTFAGLQRPVEISEPDKVIPADSFYFSSGYAHFTRYRAMRETLKNATSGGLLLNGSFIDEFTSLNPDLYEGYELAGDYYLRHHKTGKAGVYFRKALEKEIPRMDEKRKIIHKLCSCTIN